MKRLTVLLVLVAFILTSCRGSRCTLYAKPLWKVDYATKRDLKMIKR